MKNREAFRKLYKTVGSNVKNEQNRNLKTIERLKNK